MLKPCSVLPDLAHPPRDDTCLAEIAASFVFVMVLGEGQFGVVAKLSVAAETTQAYAVKIAHLDDNARADIKIACLLNGLHDETNVFVRTYGWLTCDFVPWQWPIDMDIDEPVLYQFMDVADEAFDDRRIRFSRDEIVAMFFLLVHGLYVARKRLGAFVHDDIHEGNIMLHTVSPKLATRALGYSVQGLRFMPKLIDYGLSSTDKRETHDVGELVFTLAGALHPRARRDEFEEWLAQLPVYEPARVSRSDDYKVLVPLLEALAGESDLIRPSNGTERIGPRCTRCFVDARMMWDGTDVTFCSEKCAAKKSKIGQFF